MPESRRLPGRGEARHGGFALSERVSDGEDEPTVVAIPRGFGPRSRPADAAEPSSPEKSGRVAHYRLLDQLGRGGMGVVYRAEDTRLRRTVALKFLPAGLTRDLAAKARFLQEAQSASALDHSNICTIYEVGEAGDGELYLAMACYEGETLRARIDRGPLAAAEALSVARQVAQGLAKAHREGIVHRDIKPANLMVTKEGVVKILDFGIAKLLGEAGGSVAGAFAGTPAYMSPEQALGEEVDARTDVWSLGVVLCEMLTGARPAQDQPRGELPGGLKRILDRMLARSPAERYPSAVEALADLVAFEDGQAKAKSRRRTLLWSAAAAMAVAVIGGGLWVSWQEEAPIQGVVKRLTNQEGLEEYPSLSPEGASLVYVRTVDGQRDLYWQRVEGGEPTLLTPDSPEDDTHPAFSPDGRLIAFRSGREGGGIYIVPAQGGATRRICDFGYNPAWSPDGTEIAVATHAVLDPLTRSPNSQIWRVSLETGQKRLIVKDDGVQPSWSPDGQRIAYWSLSAGHDGRILWTVPVDGGPAVKALDDGFLNWNPVWSPDGHSLFFGSDRNGSFNLWRLPIEQSSGLVSGKPQLVPASSPSAGFWSTSRDGRKVIFSANESKSNLVRYDFDPEKLEVVGAGVPVTRGSETVQSCDISPDGKWIAFHGGVPQEDLFVVRADGRTSPRRLTEDPYKDRHPFWSPDGRQLLFYSNRRGLYEPWIVPWEGGGAEPLLKDRGAVPVVFPIWSPDGNRVACILDRQAAVIDVKQSVEARRPTLLPSASGVGEEFFPTSWSADGQWLAGEMVRLDGSASEGFGRFSFKTGSFERLASQGSMPLWLADGKGLIYVERDGVFLLILRNNRVHKLLDPGPNTSFSMAELSHDQLNLFAVRSEREGDVWLFEFR